MEVGMGIDVDVDVNVDVRVLLRQVGNHNTIAREPAGNAAVRA
jgi:hypothetical protein